MHLRKFSRYGFQPVGSPYLAVGIVGMLGINIVNSSPLIDPAQRTWLLSGSEAFILVGPANF